ncbi:kinase-like domain-containing protein [Glomus cerebriforme]|uniref:Kinase-like domain-containing protein n=1 Tax=Glomus cerebriforme TaxID=658196 RepID=A0A397TGB7_9GLOM|nr:kinase-like domain-containing protein [Glomus cerebriforme]
MKKTIVTELSIIDFFESKFNSLNIKRYQYGELENVRYVDSKIFGKVQNATLKENKTSVMLKPIGTEDIHDSINEIKLMWEAGPDKSTLKFYGITKDPTKDEYFLILEYVDCLTFTQHLQDMYDYMDWNVKANLAFEIANGIKFLHEHNISHKNLTADNILYYKDTIKLINFGLFRNNVPQKRNLKKKLSFWKKDKEHNHPKEHDILSLGIVLFQLTQHVDYYKNWEEYLKTIPLEHREIKMDNIPVEYKKKYKELCKSCWSKNINERPSIHQIVNTLQDLGGNDLTDFVYNASQPGSETINDTTNTTTPITNPSQPISYTAPHKPVTSSTSNQSYTTTTSTTSTTTNPFTSITTTPLTSTNPSTNPLTSSLTSTNPLTSSRTSTNPLTSSLTSTDPLTSSRTSTNPLTSPLISTNPLISPYTYPTLTNSSINSPDSARSPLTIDFILSPQQLTSLIYGLTTPSAHTTGPVTQEYVTKMYKTFHDKIAKCEMDISKLNDLYIIQYLNNTVQNENKVFDFCNANQSLAINKVLLALFHQLAIGTSTVNLSKAYGLYKEVSNKNSFAAYVAGTYAQYGQGVPKNATEAYNFYKSSAENGFVPAYNKIGLCYDMGTGVTVDKQKAFHWIEKSAKADDKYGQYNLGAYYETGNGCVKDESKGFTWYLKAADQGFITALNKVGLCYLQGKGTTIDYFRSYEWFKKAAIAGCKYGQVNVGSAYELGRGVEKNEQEAFNWFLKAANNENYDLGQYYLARCYEFGIGTTKNMVKALEWYQKSSDNGNTLARLALADIRSKSQQPQLIYFPLY